MNNTLLKLVQQAKERLEVEKGQASKAHSIAPAMRTPAESAPKFRQGSVNPTPDRRRNASQDSPLFASDDDQLASPYAERIYDRSHQDDQSEASSTNGMRFRMQHEITKRNFVQQTNVNSLPSQAKRYNPTQSLGKDVSEHTPIRSAVPATPLTGQVVSAELLWRILLNSGKARKMQNRVLAVGPQSQDFPSVVYLTTERGSEYTLVSCDDS